MDQQDWQAIAIHPADNVAVALADLAAGNARVRGKDGLHPAIVSEPILMGHKFALRSIAEGELIHKYGEPIGVASRDIGAGSHVHVHNVRSRRGRPFDGRM